MALENNGFSVFEGLLSRVSSYVRKRIPCKFRSRIDVDDILQEIARTILRTTLQRPLSQTSEDWERMIWVVVQRQVRKQLKNAASPEDLDCRRLQDHEQVLFSTAASAESLTCDALDELSVVLNMCSERQRRIVRYRLQGFNMSEIATREGVNEGSIRRQLLIIEDLYLGQGHG